MKLYKLFINLLSIIILTTVFITCTKDADQVSGSGTTTQSGRVSGYIINGITGAPVADAEVTLVAVNNIPSPVLRKTSALTTVSTDDAGRYQFVSVDEGTYNVLANKDSLTFFHDSILVGEQGTDAGMDTLRRAGSLSGRILLDATDDPRTVMILFIGTNVFAVPRNVNGDFTIPNLGQGDYPVRFLSTLDSYYPKDTVLHVFAGLKDTLRTPIRLPVRGIPMVSGLSVTWDTLQLKATVLWHPLDTSIVSGYKVFRGIVGNPLPSTPINPFLVNGNSFTDSTCGSDSVYYYFVAAVNSSGQQGNYSNTDTINSVSAYKLVKILNGITLGTTWTQFAVRDAKLYWLNQNSVDVHDTTGALLNSFGITGPETMYKPLGPKIYGDTIYVISKDSSNIKFLKTYIDKFSFSGSHYSRDSLENASIAVSSIGGDITKGKDNDLYYTNGSIVLRFGANGILDSINSPISFRFDFQRMEYVDSMILYPISSKEMATNKVNTEIALLNPDLSIKQLIQNDRYLQGFSVSPSGEIFLIGLTEIRVVTKKMMTIKKIPIPVSVYKDVEVDTDGTVYLFDYSNKRILIYVKR